MLATARLRKDLLEDQTFRSRMSLGTLFAYMVCQRITQGKGEVKRFNFALSAKGDVVRFPPARG